MRVIPASLSRLLAVLLLASDGVAHADEPEISGGVEEVVVTADPLEPYTAEEAISATKTDTPLIEIPQAVRVVPEPLIEDRNARSLQDALQTVAGVVTGGYFTGYDYYRIRGFSNAGYTYLDGLPADRSFWIGEETFGLDRLEVLRGPTSSLYGQGPPGGLVNLVSKLPRMETKGQLRLSGGNFGLFELDADVGAPLAAFPGVAFRLNAVHRRYRSFTEFVDPSSRTFVAPALAWNLGKRTTINFLGQYLDDARVLGFALPAPGTVLPNRYGRLPVDLNVGEPGFQNESPASRTQLGWLAEHRFDDVFTLRNRFRYAWNQGRIDAIYSALLSPNDRTLFRYAFHSAEDYDTLAQDTSLVARFTTGPAKHTALAGVDYYRLASAYDSGSAQIAPLDIIDPVYGATPGPFGTAIDQRQTADAVGVYVQEQARLWDQLTLLVGARFDSAANDVRSELDGDATASDDSAISPRAGAIWEFVRGLALYANYAESFLPQPSVLTSDGTPLDPETSQGYEVGLKTDLWRSRAVGTLAAWKLTRQNVAVPDPENPAFSIQTGEQQSHGVELESTVYPLRGWDIAAAFTWTNADVTEDTTLPVGTRLLNVPAIAITGWTKYTLEAGPLEGLGAGVGGRWYSNQAADLPNTFDLPAYGLLEFGFFYDRGPFRTQVNLSNALDARAFIGSYSATYVLPAQPLAVAATIDWYF